MAMSPVKLDPVVASMKICKIKQVDFQTYQFQQTLLYLYWYVRITKEYFGLMVQREAESWQPVPSVAMVTNPLPAINGGVASLLCSDSQGVGGVSVHVVVHGQAVGLICKWYTFTMISFLSSCEKQIL